MIHNPVKPLKERKSYVTPSKKNIICVGRIDHNKNVELVVEAFIELHKKRDDIRLIIVGGGVYDNAISRIGLNYQDICFTGMLNKVQLEEVYHDAHVGVTDKNYLRKNSQRKISHRLCKLFVSIK